MNIAADQLARRELALRLIEERHRRPRPAPADHLERVRVIAGLRLVTRPPERRNAARAVAVGA